MRHQVMAVDKDEKRVNAVLPFVMNAQIGDATNEEFLESLGVNNFDVCIVAIGDDFQSSLETTSLLKELDAKKIVSRAAREVHAKFLLRNGADEIVYPERQLADWTAIRYTADHILDYIEGVNACCELFDEFAGHGVCKTELQHGCCGHCFFYVVICRTACDDADFPVRHVPPL